ncbi:unnamed protein product, partial [Prunus brigantina]
ASHLFGQLFLFVLSLSLLFFGRKLSLPFPISLLFGLLFSLVFSCFSFWSCHSLISLSSFLFSSFLLLSLFPVSFSFLPLPFLFLFLLLLLCNFSLSLPLFFFFPFFRSLFFSSSSLRLYSLSL